MCNTFSSAMLIQQLVSLLLYSLADSALADSAPLADSSTNWATKWAKGSVCALEPKWLWARWIPCGRLESNLPELGQFKRLGMDVVVNAVRLAYYWATIDGNAEAASAIKALILDWSMDFVLGSRAPQLFRPTVFGGK